MARVIRTGSHASHQLQTCEMGGSVSNFYAVLHGIAKTKPTARGHYSLEADVAGWKGCIKTRVYKENDIDYYEVLLTPWKGSPGSTHRLAWGLLDAEITP